MSERQSPRVDVFIGVGSNLNDPLRQVVCAILELGQIRNTDYVAQSSLYASPPMGPPGQPDYVNAVVQLSTGLKPLALLDELQAIERAHGRLRGAERWGPRTLDLDILLYGDRCIESERLTVPHPGLHERAFVLYPLQEVVGDRDVPGLGNLRALVRRCPRGELRRLETA
jgi:2-amino-4-hydroxy-6-hydroxymethyldihydropteridine diphosphokinase